MAEELMTAEDVSTIKAWMAGAPLDDVTHAHYQRILATYAALTDVLAKVSLLERTLKLTAGIDRQNVTLRAAITEREGECERLTKENARLFQDRYDALSVTSRDGLLSSEWVARTGKAERQRDEAHAELTALRQREAEGEVVVPPRLYVGEHTIDRVETSRGREGLSVGYGPDELPENFCDDLQDEIAMVFDGERIDVQGWDEERRAAADIHDTVCDEYWRGKMRPATPAEVLAVFFGTAAARSAGEGAPSVTAEDVELVKTWRDNAELRHSPVEVARYTRWLALLEGAQHTQPETRDDK